MPRKLKNDAQDSARLDPIGFVGLGHMGGNMAARFLEAGHAVCGTARSRERAEWLVDRGLGWLETPREIAEAASFVLTSLPDDEAVVAVAEGADGLLAGLGVGGIWADLSTISPGASRDLSTRVAELGAEMLDAPVSGSVPQIESGTLTIMVGGDEAAYARAEPILRLLGTPTRIGVNGQGLVLKLAINISLAAQMLAFSEGLLLAEQDGIDPALAGKVMAASSIGSPMLKARLPLVLDLPEEAWFDVGLLRKDIGLALATARDLGVASPAAHAADLALRQAVEAGFEHRDIASLFQLLGRLEPEA